jgi:hypothetical protein
MGNQTDRQRIRYDVKTKQQVLMVMRALISAKGYIEALDEQGATKLIQANLEASMHLKARPSLP